MIKERRSYDQFKALIAFNEVARVTGRVEYGKLLPVIVALDVGRDCPANPLNVVGSVVGLIELLPQICNKPLQRHVVCCGRACLLSGEVW